MALADWATEMFSQNQVRTGIPSPAQQKNRL